MSENTKAVVFAAVLSLVCCVLITAACTGLQKFQRINAELDRQVNIIKSVGLVEDGKKYSKEDIARLYSDHIVNAWTTDTGTLEFKDPGPSAGAHELYLDKNKDRLNAYIIPINVRGLWGRIYGYLAVNSDGETVEGFTVYKHSETPGLGGEIESAWFRANFKGKKIVDTKGNFASISVAKGKASDHVSNKDLPNYVDGISGATLTGKYLTQGLKQTLAKFEPLASELRTKGPSDIQFKE
jgi:Na+-transporting NADH:ubiquinone oxidoreductase subunit C